jgi:uncharacterized protein YdaU (DUF1376 family)
MREKSPAFQWYPKQFLGDDDVLAMEWDARGMHVWLLNLSWQQEPRGTLPNDTAQIRRWLSSPSDDVWRRVWPQIKAAWFIQDGRWANKGMLKSAERQKKYAERNSTQISAKPLGDEESGIALEVLCLEAQQIYELYPRKTAKPKALEAIHKAILRESVKLGGQAEAIAYIKTQTMKFAKSPSIKAKLANQEEHFIPYPATWFNQDRFNDETDWRRAEGSNNGVNKTATTKGSHNLEILKRSIGEDFGCEGSDDDGPQAGRVRIEPMGRPVIEMEPEGH